LAESALLHGRRLASVGEGHHGYSLIRDTRVPRRIAASLAQQAAEKALRAAVASVVGAAPRIHDLVRLAQIAGAPMPSATADQLRLLSDAHIQGRYPEPTEPACSRRRPR
jgi:HEPN domain